jgi:rSAM/selenodomain-associated transferase 1
MDRILLAQLARAPAAGKVKTRLQAVLSPDEAAALHEAMVEHCCTMLRDSGLGVVQLWVEGDPEHTLFQRLLSSGKLQLKQQRGTDLGQRMAAIVEEGLQEYRAVILVGSDVPALDAGYIGAAVAALEEHDVVLGPALDGGYVLVGLRREIPELFRDIPWGTERVLQATIGVLEALACDFKALEALPDIDRPEDLRHLPDHLLTATSASGSAKLPDGA